MGGLSEASIRAGDGVCARAALRGRQGRVRRVEQPRQAPARVSPLRKSIAIEFRNTKRTTPPQNLMVLLDWDGLTHTQYRGTTRNPEFVDLSHAVGSQRSFDGLWCTHTQLAESEGKQRQINVHGALHTLGLACASPNQLVHLIPDLLVLARPVNNMHQDAEAPTRPAVCHSAAAPHTSCKPWRRMSRMILRNAALTQTRYFRPRGLHAGIRGRISSTAASPAQSTTSRSHPGAGSCFRHRSAS